MKISKFQYITGFLALVVTLMFVLVGQTYWEKHFVSQPLDKALKSIVEIKKIEIKSSKKFNEPLDITLTLDKVSNLQKTYKAINESITAAYDKKLYKLVIKDNRSAELEQLFDEINYYVQEAMLDGNFPLLAEKAKELSLKQGVESKVFIDNSNIYIQLSNKTSSLYEVVPRFTDRSGGSSI